MAGSLRLTRIEQAFEFDKIGQIFLAARGPFRSDQSTEIQRLNPAPERLHGYCVHFYAIKIAQTRDFREEIDLAQIGLEREYSGIAKRGLIPNKRQIGAETSRARMERRESRG